MFHLQTDGKLTMSRETLLVGKFCSCVKIQKVPSVQLIKWRAPGFHGWISQCPHDSAAQIWLWDHFGEFTIPSWCLVPVHIPFEGDFFLLMLSSIHLFIVYTRSWLSFWNVFVKKNPPLRSNVFRPLLPVKNNFFGFSKVLRNIGKPVALFDELYETLCNTLSSSRNLSIPSIGRFTTSHISWLLSRFFRVIFRKKFHGIVISSWNGIY